MKHSAAGAIVGSLFWLNDIYLLGMFDVFLFGIFGKQNRQQLIKHDAGEARDHAETIRTVWGKTHAPIINFLRLIWFELWPFY